MNRTCSVCRSAKPPDEFGIDRRSPDGCKAKCRLCEKAYNLAWSRAHKDSVNARQRQWVALNPEKKRASDAKRSRQNQQAYHRSDRAKALNRERKRKEYLRRRIVLLDRAKTWAKSNRDKIRRRRAQPHRRLHSNMSRSIRSALKLQKSGRRWEVIVGYSRDDLVAHLENQFTAGMSWSNYGEWEIDHIRPRASFSFTTADDPDFKACWALSNLQPLWMSANRSKHAKWAA